MVMYAILTVVMTHTDNADLIHWPAIIRHAGDVELLYISDQAAWRQDADLHDFVYDAADCLIDSSGKIYTLTTRANNQVLPQASGKVMPLTEILGYIKAHAAQKGSCCVAKLYAPGIVEAFKIVAAMDEF